MYSLCNNLHLISKAEESGEDYVVANLKERSTHRIRRRRRRKGKEFRLDAQVDGYDFK